MMLKFQQIFLLALPTCNILRDMHSLRQHVSVGSIICAILLGQVSLPHSEINAVR